MYEVPSDLYPDILSRVFVKSLLRFRCVCKAWCRIIDDPSFIKLHLHRQSDSGHLIFCNDTCSEYYTLSLDSLSYCNSSKTPSGMVVVSSPLKTSSIRRGLPRGCTFPVGSCNGLILISDKIINVGLLWNPFTREVHELPSPRSYSKFCGLGYDSVTDDYKVVKIVDYHVRRETLVYSLKSNSWKKVKDYPHYLSTPMVHGVFANGALHWNTRMTGNRYQQIILAFDLASEDYYTLPFPPVLPSTVPMLYYQNILSALGDCLLVTWKDSVYRWDDYGGKNSWTKLFSYSGKELENARPIAYLKSKGEVLVRAPRGKYFMFDIEKNSAIKVSTDGARNRWYSQICLPSLVRLSNSGGVDVKDTSRRKRKSLH